MEVSRGMAWHLYTFTQHIVEKAESSGKVLLVMGFLTIRVEGELDARWEEEGEGNEGEKERIE